CWNRRRRRRTAARGSVSIFMFPTIASVKRRIESLKTKTSDALGEKIVTLECRKFSGDDRVVMNGNESCKTERSSCTKSLDQSYHERLAAFSAQTCKQI